MIGRRCKHGNVFSRPVLIGRGLDRTLTCHFDRCSCSLWSSLGAQPRPRQQVPGGHGGGVTPVPIPNTVVKPARADGTWRESSWESRSPPGYFDRTMPALVAGIVAFRRSRPGTLHNPSTTGREVPDGRRRREEDDERPRRPVKRAGTPSRRTAGRPAKRTGGTRGDGERRGDCRQGPRRAGAGTS